MLIQRIKGVKVTPIKFSIGNGSNSIAVLGLEFSIKNKNNNYIFQYSYSFFHFGVYGIHDCGSYLIRIRASVLFKSFTIHEKQITPKWDKCVVCEGWCHNKKFYVENAPICCEECKSDYEYSPETYKADSFLTDG